MPLVERDLAVRDGGQRTPDLSRFSELWSEDPAKRSTQLAEGFCAWRVAGRRAPMAPHLHVDLSRDRPRLPRLRGLQRKVQASALRTTRPAGSVADGAPLLLLWSEAACERGLQPATEVRVHLCDCFGCAVSADRSRGLETGPVFLAGMDDGRLPLGAALAFPHHVGDAGVCFRTFGDGGPAWLEQFRLHVHGMEEGPGISIGVVRCAVVKTQECR